MRRFLAAIFLAVCFCSGRAWGAYRVTVFKIDDTQVSGLLLSTTGGNVTLSPPEGGISPGPVIAMADISRVEFRTALVAAAPQPVALPPPATLRPPRQNAGGFFGAIFNGGSSDDVPPADAGAQPAQQAEAVPTSRPANEIDWSLDLADGDHLKGRISHWADDQLTLSIGQPQKTTIDIAPDQISQLWCGSDDARHRAKALNISSNGQDVAYVLKDNDVVAVNGTALGIAGDSLRFRYQDTERKVALGRLVGVVMAPAAAKPPQGLCQCIRMDWGASLTGQWTGMDDDSVSLALPWGAAAKIPITAIASIDFRNGRMVYLSDLKPAKVEQTPFFGRVIPYRLDAALDGGPLLLSDGPYAKGIAVHSRCVLEYNLGGEFERFIAKVGFAKSATDASDAGAVIRVKADDKTVYENADAHPDEKPAQIDASVAGVNRLILEVDFAKDQDVDGRVDWANARLFRAKPPG
jgi:hypothetical protein